MNARRPGVVLAVVVALVAVALGVSAFTHPTSTAPHGVGSVTAEVRDATLVCGAVPSGAGVTSIVSAGAAGPASGSGDAISIRRLGQAGTVKPLATTAPGATVVRVAVPPHVASPMVIHATGSLARGLSGYVWVQATKGAGQGLASIPCTAPTNDSWFMGGGAGVGRTSTLVLTNPDAAASTVDITAYGAKGPAQSTLGQGVTVPAGKQVKVVLDTLIPGEPATAVEVRSRSGRVAAVLTDTQVVGLNPGGSDAVAPAAPPATSVVVPGVGGDADGRRALTLVVPGADNAVVRVRVSTGQGLLSPQDLAGLEVPAGQLFTVDLSKLGAIGPYALVIDSDQPLVAGVRLLRSVASTVPDFAYATSALPITAPVMVPFGYRSATLGTRLLLTATGDQDRTVEVTSHPDAGRTLVLPVKITAGTTVAVAVGGTQPGSFSVTVTPTDSGDNLYGAWVASGLSGTARLVTGLPLVGSPATETLPGVLQDPSVGLPGH